MTKRIGSLQKIFNAAWKAFIVENKKPSYQRNRGCRYRLDDGSRCAVGLVLTKDECSMCEGRIFGAIKIDSPLKDFFDKKFPDLVDYDTGSLNLFQKELHDDLVDDNTRKWAYSKREREKIYIGIAKKYNLTIPKKKKK